MGWRGDSWISWFVAGAALCGCSGAPETTTAGTNVVLVDVTAESRLDFVHESGARGNWEMPEIMGGGAALLDYDNDGDLDVYLTNGAFVSGPADATGAPANRLFRQEAGGKFTDVTEASGTGDRGYGMGVAVGDIDNDGNVDLYLTNHGPDRLLRNRGDGAFVDLTEAAGIDAGGWSSSATFLDYDRDGWLDLFVARYLRYEPGKRCPDSAGRPNYCGPDSFDPDTDVLFRNLGGGRFADVSDAAGIAAGAKAGAGLGVVAADLNDDGLPDVYVANDGHPNHLWINQGDGTFREEALLLGTALDLHGRAEAGMGVLAADLDHDGDLDLFLTHLANETNTIYRSRGEGRGYDDTSGASGIGAASLDFTGFGAAAVDLEQDGDLDLVVANGRVSRQPARPDAAVGQPWDLFAEPNLVLLNDGAGAFASGAAGFTEPVEVSRGLAAGDVDNDGDVDLLLANIGSPVRLYENRTPAAGGWLTITAFDPRLRRHAIGSRVEVVLAGGRRLVQTVQRGSSYLSSGDPRAHFGLGAGRPERVEVLWLDGLREAFPVEAVDRGLRLERGAGETVP